jgi:hypothetical protein
VKHNVRKGKTQMPEFKDALRAVAAVAMGVTVVGLTGCAEEVVASEPVEVAVKIDPIKGTDLSKVTLTERAMTRLGVKIEPVRPAPKSAGIVSFSAILYDASGAAWVYTSPAPRTFVRAPIVVDRVEGNVASLKSGPKVGTQVASIAVQELYGAENGVGGE